MNKSLLFILLLFLLSRVQLPLQLAGRTFNQRSSFLHKFQLLVSRFVHNSKLYYRFVIEYYVMRSNFGNRDVFTIRAAPPDDDEVLGSFHHLATTCGVIRLTVYFEEWTPWVSCAPGRWSLDPGVGTARASNYFLLFHNNSYNEYKIITFTILLVIILIITHYHRYTFFELNSNDKNLFSSSMNFVIIILLAIPNKMYP